jgi:hypothetical protein
MSLKTYMKTGGSAFACAADGGHQAGMTLREYAALQILPELLREAHKRGDSGTVAIERSLDLSEKFIAMSVEAQQGK